MASYTKTYDVMKALQGQILDQMGEEIDGAIIYDGGLQEAFDNHFGQSQGSSLRAFVFFGISNDSPDGLTGSGGPVRQGLAVDFYVAVRATGTTRYAGDLERLYAMSDLVQFVVFDPANWTSDMKTKIGAVEFGFRQRTVTSSDLFVHQVRFVFRPRR
jgi:hypothetical protein